MEIKNTSNQSIFNTQEKIELKEFLQILVDSKFDVKNLNLQCADLDEMLFENVNFRGSNMHRVNFSKTDLNKANLTYCNLIGADLTYAILKNTDFHGACLNGANLIGADTNGADFESACTKNAIFTKNEQQFINDNSCHIRNIETKNNTKKIGMFQFIKNKKSHGEITDNKTKNMKIHRTSGEFVLEQMDCSSAQELIKNSYLIGFDIKKLNLKEIDARSSQFMHANFRDGYMHKANFVNASLVGCSFINCDLSKVNFNGANLTNVDFYGACLNGASFANAIIDGADFTNACICNTIFSSNNRHLVNQDSYCAREIEVHYGIDRAVSKDVGENGVVLK